MAEENGDKTLQDEELDNIQSGPNNGPKLIMEEGAIMTDKDQQNESNEQIFKSAAEVSSFYVLKDIKSKPKNNNFKRATFEPNSQSNSFRTDGERLPKWIYAIQEKLFCEIGPKEEYKVNWKDKTDHKGKFVEILIQIFQQDSDGKEELGLTIHIYLTTALIQVQGTMLETFMENLFPTIHSLVEMDVESLQSTEISQRNITQQEVSAGPVDECDIIKEVQESLQIFRKINLQSMLTHIQSGQDNLTSRLQKLEQSHSNLSKKVVENAATVMSEISKIDVDNKQPAVSTESESEEKAKQEQIISSIRNENDILHSEIERKNCLKCKINQPHKDEELQSVIREQDAIIQNLKLKIDESQTSIQSEWNKRKEIEIKCTQIKGELGILEERNVGLMQQIHTLNDEIKHARSFAGFGGTTGATQINQADTEDETPAAEDVLLFGDSHLKRITAEWLLKKEGKSARIVAAPHLANLKKTLVAMRNNPECILIHCGTNDLQSRNPEEIVTLMMECIEVATAKAQTVIVGSLLPRYDDPNLHLKTQIVNAMLLEKSMENDQLFMCDNNNLNIREDQVRKFFTEDKLHLNQEGSSVLASNIRSKICGVLHIQIISRGRSPSPKSRRGRFRNNYNNNYYRGFKLKSFPRPISANNRHFGGLLLVYREIYDKGIKIINKKLPDKVWLKLDMQFFGLRRDIYICFCYISPSSSPYYNSLPYDLFNEIELDHTSIISSKSSVLLAGDFNGRTNQDPDYVIDLTDEHSPINDLNFYKRDEPLPRNNADNAKTDKHGSKILEICKAKSFRIINGRFPGDHIGAYTRYPNSSTESPSVIDYMISDQNLFQDIKNFEVLPPNELSDHCCLKLSINCCNPLVVADEDQAAPINPFNNINFKPTREALTKFKNKLGDFKNDIQQICNANAEDNQDTINKIADDLNEMILKAAESTVIVKSKEYKRYLRKAEKEYKVDMTNKLLNVEQRDPKLFWKLIKEMRQWGKTNTDDTVSIKNEDWYTYFKNLFAPTSNDDKELVERLKSLENIPSFTELDYRISELEISKCIKKLKKNKSAGPDKIVNELLIAGEDTLLVPICKIFNMIFRCSRYPRGWNLSYLKPIHKKGALSMPDNYRGIAIGSSIGKLFQLGHT
eukprot:Seg5571.1 transcript_id=Seg5571.1/GoldUCD/mRNA.D3Y31 product="putative RNA-directed DNA polymerase from transposon X-element" protein_id=Seg5571.1/GoldUCD/D3Y31